MKTIKSFLAILFMAITFGAQVIAQTNNTATGTNAGNSNSSQNNSAFGANALANNANRDNSAFGSHAMESNTSGLYNSAFGSHALQNGETGVHNSAFGYFALNNSTAGYNAAFGSSALASNTTGVFNCALGRQSLLNNTTGSWNIGLGGLALRDNTASGNVAIGYYALPVKTAGGGNIAMGHWAGSNLTSGSSNILIGYQTAQGLTTGDNNVIIGRRMNGLPSNLDNTIIIGTNVTQRLYIHSNGFAGIGTGNNQIPANRLEIGNGLNGTAGLRFRGINSTMNTSFTNGLVLTVNQDGDVVLAEDQTGSGGGSNVNIYNSDGTLTGDRTVSMVNNRLMFNTATNGSIYVGNTSTVTDNDNFPTTTGNYRLYVEGGILTEKVKVALRNPNTNWADYVFEEDYKLMSLNEVESFIRKHKHLPGIASANDLVENGLDLADMQAKQMEKIEELTLYIIEQHKNVEKQQKEIEKLKAMVKALTKQ